MRVVLFGPPRSGKEAQAARLGVSLISMPDVMRTAMKTGTEHGQRARAFMERGELVPLDVAMGIVEARLREPDVANGFVLVDFPRTVEQAEALDRLVTLDRCIVLRVDENVEDDELRLKLQHYREKLQPVLDYYAGRGLLVESIE